METTRPVVPPFYSENTVAQVHALHACQREAGHRRARVLVVASDPRWGGGRRAEGHIAHALADFAMRGILKDIQHEPASQPTLLRDPLG